MAIHFLIGLHGDILRCMELDTWFARGFSSRIDFVMDWVPADPLELQTGEGGRKVLGCDHDPLFVSYTVKLRSSKLTKRIRPVCTKCGKWRADLIAVKHEADLLQEHLLVHEQRDLTANDVEQLSSKVRKGPGTFRYKDAEEIRELIRIRKTLCKAKRLESWLAGLLLLEEFAKRNGWLKLFIERAG